MLGNAVKKKMKLILPTLSKNHTILWQKLKIILKKPKWHWKITSRFHRGKEKERPAGHVGVFCQNLGMTAYTLENYSNFKTNFSFNNESILEIHDYFRTSSKGHYVPC